MDGYKAGNLNHWLRRYGRQFPHFLVLDHDSVVNSRTVTRGLRWLAAEGSAAFVQFAHLETSRGQTGFAKALGASVRATWWVQSLRATYGLPTCFGHAVLFRTDVVNRLGGFPETLTEDIAMTLKLLRHGFLGRYDIAMPAAEMVPDTYARFRARYLRWCIGTVQSWLHPDARPVGSQLVSPLALDGMLQALVLLYPIPVALFGLGVALMAPSASGSAALRSPVIISTAWLSIVCPMVPVIAVAKGPWDAARSAVTHALVYLSMIVPAAYALAEQALFGRAVWLNTGNRLSQSIAWPTITTLVELVFAAWLLWCLPEAGILVVPLIAGIVVSILFQAQTWISLWAEPRAVRSARASGVLRLAAGG